MSPQWFHRYVVPTIGVACVCALLSLLARAWFEVASGILDGDALIFRTVGQGITNGLLPYQDLFETKPPAIFLLHALSLYLFHSQLLVKLLQALVLLGIPVLVFLPALRIIEERSAAERRMLSVLTLLFGLLLALYTGRQAGEGLPESYGAFFGIAVLVLVFDHKTYFVRHQYMRMFDVGLFMLFAIGFKEPFLFSILAGIILLQPREERVVRYYGMNVAAPLCIAGALGLIALLVFGYFGPFFTIYLKHMMGFHVHQHDGSTFVRALEVWRTFFNLGAFSWWFTGGVTVMWLWVVVDSVCNRAVGSAVRWVVASYLLLFSAAIGGDFYGHHFVFMVPGFAALWWMLLRGQGKGKGQGLGLGLGVVGVLFVCAAVGSVRVSYAVETERWKQSEAEMKRVAGVFDEVMDRCGWEKYLQTIPRGGGAYAYTQHSPYGPVFLHHDRQIGGNRMYQTRYIAALKEAPLVMAKDLESSNLTEYALQYFSVHYTEEPPACVGDHFAQPEPYTILFRRED